MNKKVKIVVFDDDPTGIQTVHGCLLVTDWSEENVVKAFEDEADFFYVLTNSRALTEADARQVLTSAVEAVMRVNDRYGYKLICISRSDSCLRGHFKMETDVMRSILEAHGKSVMPLTPFCPAFIESGRVTIDGTHYMRQGDRLIPTSETEFARDNVFGYSTSVLHDYIIEKGGNPKDYDIVNAQSYEELDAYRDELFKRINDYDAIVIRSSSSLPRSLSMIDDKPYLSREELGIKQHKAGIFIVGSHVKKTTEQLEQLLKADGTQGIELPIDRILDEHDALMAETLSTIAAIIADGSTPVVYTARKEVRIDDAEKRQRLGQDVSNFLVEIAQYVVGHVADKSSADLCLGKNGEQISLCLTKKGEEIAVGYLVAKGGITSHDILTHGLGIKVGRVMGQAINSVPCVMADIDGNKLPYIIFPGNVGNEQSLREIFEKLR